jgi:hypothetical protein
VHPCTVDDPLAVAALAVAAEDGLQIVLANLGAPAREVTIGSQSVSLGPHEVHVLHT